MIKVGSIVWWEDPDQDSPCSFAGEVTSITGEEFYVSDVDEEGCHTGGGASALATELIELDEDWNCPHCKTRCYPAFCKDFNAQRQELHRKIKSGNYEILPEEEVFCCYECPKEDCDECEYVHPGWHQDNGVPTCPKCKIDMKYMHTQIAEEELR